MSTPPSRTWSGNPPLQAPSPDAIGRFLPWQEAGSGEEWRCVCGSMLGVLYPDGVLMKLRAREIYAPYPVTQRCRCGEVQRRDAPPGADS